METFPPHKIFPSLSLLFLVSLLQFSSLSLLSSAYTLPDKFFINCGSDSDLTLNGRRFIGDRKPDLFVFSSPQSRTVKNTNSPTNSSLYQTARIFSKASFYELQIDQNGTYMVRLHFSAFSSSLSNAQFRVSASGFSLVSDFSGDPPVIKEFLLTINVGKFTIHFTPSHHSSFAFVNAIEVFVAPESFIPDVADHITPSGFYDSTSGLLSQALHTVHRINVGGSTLTPENDSLWRSWVPDDAFLFNPKAAKNSSFYSDEPKYQAGGPTMYFAPNLVYLTAKEMNIDSSRTSNFFSITWLLGVRKNATHLVRVHFCDIISASLNVIQFNLYVYSNYNLTVDPYAAFSQLAAPFYHDFVVDSDDSGFMNISIGPREDSYEKNAFLNGLEIMEILGSLGPEVNKPPKKHVFVIVGSVVGGVAFLFILMVLVVFGRKFRKTKPVETLEWQGLVGSSFSRLTELTANASPVCNLNLGLKLSFVDIQLATNNFDANLMVGEGGFGKVYKARLRNGMIVAVKRSEPGHGQGLPEFQTEIFVLSKIRHRHLVSLIGYCDERSEMILVYEFMEKGTLRDHLYNFNKGSENSSIRTEMSWIRRLEICIGAAKGLHYLHTSSDRGIIHRDVKSTNILLDEHYVAKVADFGLSRLGSLEETHVSTDVKGSFGYLDPEYFRFLQLTQKSDVYSFGVVLLEVLCARPAINNLLPREEVNLAEWGLYWQKKGQLEKIVDPFLEGKINPHSLRMFGETVEKCLKESGVERPSMHDVLWDLEYALQLQQTGRHREPHEDSTTDASWVLPVIAVQRSPSQSLTIDEYNVPMADMSDTIQLNASEVFSQLKMDGAR
ncbi:Receptor-like protein kinase precursor [Actinidia chinensis var. chinensis]|uniref:Receptor-like protein kinase n=1 Tax=Actinidia chinensis var. chinensis TaxID=1590841 RepID=A0A2R6RL22_ACTCC|nr:Receptor-like protein kinase precursor [Actinidia chinensis var. chinensis]